MSYNELRKDYLLDRWTVIATQRSRRPTDFTKQPRQTTAKTDTCPMCPGNEHMTPPAQLLYLKKDGTITKTKDQNGKRTNKWLIRCIPNLYPAFTPPTHKEKRIRKRRYLQPAIGHHEVLIESPTHDDHPANATLEQLTLVINAYKDRLKTLSTKPYVKYVSIFRNHGLEAGASLSHAHSQIIATPHTPTIPKQEQKATHTHYQRTGECIFCNIIKKELYGPRLIREDTNYVTFAPYASTNPMEFWLFPKRHQPSFLDTTERETQTLAETLKTCLAALKKLVNDPPYNYGIHQTTDSSAKNHYHWHLEVYPKLATWAGFEKSTGTYINTIPPEIAAQSLAKAISESA